MAPPSARSAQTGRDWRPSERTIIGDFSRITAIAARSTGVYVTSPTSLLLWQPQFRRWEGPFSAAAIPAILAGVFAALIDPTRRVAVARPERTGGCTTSPSSTSGTRAG